MSFLHAWSILLLAYCAGTQKALKIIKFRRVQKFNADCRFIFSSFVFGSAFWVYCMMLCWDVCELFVVCLAVVRRKCLSSCHRCLIGFTSELSGGVFHLFISSLSINCFANLIVFFGSLSCWKRCPSVNLSRMNRKSVFFRMCSV